MTLYNQSLIDKIPYYQFDAYRYFPDILPYLHNYDEFKKHWFDLQQSRYIYSDGIEVRTASWFRYAFEAIKGFFGFNNHCQSEIVTLGLMKFSYYGYTQGYTQSLKNPEHYPMANDFLLTVTRPRHTDSTKQLQYQLINYYRENQAYYNRDQAFFAIYPNHRFGESLQQIDAPEAIPFIDPVDPKIINNTIKRLETADSLYNFIPGSDYAKAAAIFHIQESERNKGTLNSVLSFLRFTENKVYKHLKQALRFDPNCQIDNLEVYIEFYCNHNEADLAFQLIEKLPNAVEAVNTYLIKKPFTVDFLQRHVKKDSPLGIALATNYLARSYSERNVHIASQFASHIETIAPLPTFRFLVAQKSYEQAYAVFSDPANKARSFHRESSKQLASHFDSAGEHEYDEGNLLRKQQNWEQASSQYLHSLSLKERAMKLDSSDHRVKEYLTHKRLYAQILITANQHKDIRDIDIKKVALAIKILRHCYAYAADDKEKNYITKALAYGLVLSADNLCESFKVEYIYDRDFDTRKEHMKRHGKQIQIACKLLSEIIKTLNGTKDPEMKKTLAKSYYTLGDIIDFFNLTDQAYNPIDCHRYAYSLVPDNPFYILRYAELMIGSTQKQKEQLTEEALSKLRRAGYDMSKYTNWFDERWHKEKIGFHGIVNIHSAETPKEETWLNKLGF